MVKSYSITVQRGISGEYTLHSQHLQWGLNGDIIHSRYTNRMGLSERELLRLTNFVSKRTRKNRGTFHFWDKDPLCWDFNYMDDVNEFFYPQ